MTLISKKHSTAFNTKVRCAYLMKGIDPAVTDSQSLKVVGNFSCRDIVIVVHNSLTKIGYIGACETLSCQIQLGIKLHVKKQSQNS